MTYEAPHVKTTPDKITPYVLVCGDPARALEIAQLCDSYEEVSYNREYRTLVGTYKGKKVCPDCKAELSKEQKQAL